MVVVMVDVWECWTLDLNVMSKQITLEIGIFSRTRCLVAMVTSKGGRRQVCVILSNIDEINITWRVQI